MASKDKNSKFSSAAKDDKLGISNPSGETSIKKKSASHNIPYESFGLNQCKTFPVGSKKGWITPFWGCGLVVVGVNKTTGDFILFNYAGKEGGADGYLGAENRKRYDEFFAADGEKCALLVGCNVGEMNANDDIARLKKRLSEEGVSVIYVDPAQLAIPSGNEVGYDVAVNPQNGEVSIKGIGKHEMEAVTRPFGDFTPSKPSMLPRIDMIALFSREIGSELEESMTGYTFKNAKELSKHIGFVASRIKHFSEALPTNNEDVDVLKQSFARRSTLDKQAVIRPKDASYFPKAIRLFTERLAPFADVVLKLKGMESKQVPPAERTRIALLERTVEQTYTRVGEIAQQEGLQDVMAEVSAILDRFRNSGGRAIAGAKPKLSPPE